MSEEKRCLECRDWKSLDRFYNDPRQVDGKRKKCKDCCNKHARERYTNDPQVRERKAAWLQHMTPEKRRKRQQAWHLKHTFGITLDDKAQMYLEQDGRCAGCRTPSPSGALVIDHCHDTDAVRSLLCRPCNSSLGLMEESPDKLRSLALYAEHCQSLKT